MVEGPIQQQFLSHSPSVCNWSCMGVIFQLCQNRILKKSRSNPLMLGELGWSALQEGSVLTRVGGKTYISRRGEPNTAGGVFCPDPCVFYRTLASIFIHLTCISRLCGFFFCDRKWPGQMSQRLLPLESQNV